MTNLADFDRSLADFLADGPATAPEAPVIAAMAHARTTPRRPDLLRAFRADVMAPRRGRPLGLRPALLLGLLALLAALIGVAVIGSRPQGPSIVAPPDPTPSPSPSSPPSPFASPSGGPTGSATTGGPPVPLGSPAVPPIHVALLASGGNATSVDVVDESGLLTTAVSGPAAEGASVDAFDATNDTPTTLRLAWLGSPCDTVHRLTIDPTLTVLTLDRPLCGGDSIGVDRTLLLTFSRPVDATSLNTSLRAGRGGVDMPTWTAAAPDSAGNRYDLTLADPGYVVDSLEGSYDPAVEAGGAGPTGIQLVRTDAFTFRLIWLAPACATSPALSIDSSGDHWQVASAPCASSAADVLRMVDVRLREDRATVPAVEAVTAP